MECRPLDKDFKSVGKVNEEIEGEVTRLSKFKEEASICAVKDPLRPSDKCLLCLFDGV